MKRFVTLIPIFLLGCGGGGEDAGQSSDGPRGVTDDAIVIGSGISGGWAAKELCEKGLKTLVLERGRMVKHIEDYPTMNLKPWEIKYGDRLTPKEKKEDYPVQSQTAYAVLQSTKHFFVKDSEHAYNQVKKIYNSKDMALGYLNLYKKLINNI